MPAADLVVKVTGDHEALYVIIGSLGGVALGALGSWLLQRSKIRADEVQLAAKLKEERRHDELTALRQVLDEGASALARAMLVSGRLERFWARQLPGQDPLFLDAEREQRDSVSLVHTAQVRLSLRLPENDGVLDAYVRAASARNEVSQYMVENAGPTTWFEHRETMTRLNDRAQALADDFGRIAQSHYGARVDTD